MAVFTFVMRDGTVKKFDQSRPNATFDCRLRMEPPFVVLQDAYGREVFTPIADITEILKDGEIFRW